MSNFPQCPRCVELGEEYATLTAMYEVSTRLLVKAGARIDELEKENRMLLAKNAEPQEGAAC